MTIPTKTIKKWKSAAEYGDLKKMAEAAGVSYVTLYRAIKKKKCTPEMYKAVSMYVTGKKENIKKVITETE